MMSSSNFKIDKSIDLNDLRYLYEHIVKTISLPDFVESETGEDIQWVQSDNSAKACCPLHIEGIPSFHMNLMEDGVWVYHCFSGDTRVLTRGGCFPIKELSGKKVEILTKGQKWVYADFKEYGTQPLCKISLTRNLQKKTIHATRKHRWFTYEPNGEKTTDELKGGARLLSCFPKKNDANQEEALTKTQWTVESVELDVKTDTVYCAEVPDTHSFTLEDNILTGNCFGCGAKGNVIHFCRDYHNLNDQLEAIYYLCQKYKINNTSDLILEGIKQVSVKVDEQRLMENANVLVSNQCRMLLRKNFKLHKEWVAKSYRELNEALKENNKNEIDRIGYEASNRMVMKGESL